MNNAFIEKLESKSESEWQKAVEDLLPSIHEVDRNAVQIWFRFYPLDLVRFLESADDVEQAMKGVNLQGDFGLLDKIDTSHQFLYGHRFWASVKQAVQDRVESDREFSNLNAEISDLAAAVASHAKSNVSLTTAIAAVGLMTLVQAGYDELKASAAVTQRPTGLMAKSPDQIVAERAKDDSQGLFGFLRTVDKQFSVAFKASAFEGKFKVINDEEIASASQKDRSREWQDLDSRCWQGPVPIECTSASCGTCWVGVLGGDDKLSAVERKERRAVKVFGYDQTGADKPLIRLACQAKAHGNVTIVIPPWNAVFGKKVYDNVEELELEPATTSAKHLREITREAVSGE